MTKTAAYDADALEEPAEAGSGGWLREVTVQISMMIVIAALGMALRTSFGFGMGPAIVIALAVYWCLLMVHALVRRGQSAADLSAEVAHLADENAALRRLVAAPRHAVGERELPRLAGRIAERPPSRAPDRAKPPELARPRVPEALKAEPPKAGSAPRTGESAVRDPAKAKAPIAPAPVAPKPTAASPARHAVMARGGQEDGGTSKLGTAASGMRAGPPPPPPARPRPQGLAALAVEKPAAKASIEAPRETPDPGDPRAQDIAIMQSLIKGLADQINGPIIKADTQRAPVAPAPSPAASAPALDTVEEQVGALRDIADDMRDSLIAPAARAAALSGVLGVRDELARAIEASRVDVCLDPILGLDDRRARHFEVSVRLRSESGEILDPRALAGSIAGTGLTPRIEALTFTETIRLAGEFAARGAAADLFSTASGESLRDGDFNVALSGALAPEATVGTRLVMSIAQAEVRAFGPAHWAALAALSEAGLRYALVDVVDLDMDFEELADRGFEFVRLDAQVFLQGLPAPHGFVPAADLCRHLSGLGFTLIVSRIAEERELVKVLGFGALLGQGRLFGGPRPIRQDRAAHRPSAA